MPAHSFGCILGDSTIAEYGELHGIDFYLLTPADVDAGSVVNNDAVVGHSIGGQKAVWIADPEKADYDWVIAQVGINDIAADSPLANCIAAMQSLVDTIAADNPGALIIISTINPFLYGSGARRTVWTGFNAAIRGEGATPVTGADVRLSQHTTDLSGANDILAPEYDSGDGTHENNDGRELIAAEWHDALAAEGMLVSDMANMDTAEKRLSTLDWDCPFMPGIAIPTLTPGAGERMHGMFGYSGIASASPTTPTVGASSSFQTSPFQESSFQTSSFQQSAFGQ